MFLRGRGPRAEREVLGGASILGLLRHLQGDHMKAPSRRARNIGTIVATPIAVVAAAAMVWQSSYAAFSGTTRNSGNSWSTGSVALTDDDSGSARFQATGMVPGSTDTKC